MKMLNVEIENRAVKDLKGSFVRIDTDKSSSIIARTSEFDIETNKRKEIPLKVIITYEGENIFKGSMCELASKLNKDTTSPKGVVDILFNYFNSFASSNHNKLIELMARQHRTLQQNFTRFCLSWLRYLASLNENQYDARNEASVKLAKKMVKEVEDETLPFI